jgi:hypothetical protein
MKVKQNRDTLAIIPHSYHFMSHSANLEEVNKSWDQAGTEE